MVLCLWLDLFEGWSECVCGCARFFVEKLGWKNREAEGERRKVRKREEREERERHRSEESRALKRGLDEGRQARICSEHKKDRYGPRFDWGPTFVASTNKTSQNKRQSSHPINKRLLLSTLVFRFNRSIARFLSFFFGGVGGGGVEDKEKDIVRRGVSCLSSLYFAFPWVTNTVSGMVRTRYIEQPRERTFFPFSITPTVECSE